MSFSYWPQPVPLARDGAIVRVYRYNPDGGDEGKFQSLPNIRCISVEFSEGAEPGAARFRYVFDSALGLPGVPSRLEHVYPLGASGRYVVAPDDRLVVVRHGDDGGSDFLFDGFALVPQADLSPEGESVTFTAMATPVREWDTPLPGALMRDADDPAVVSDIQTDLPLRFNPDGRPNMTPADADAGDGDETHPTFLGPIGRPTGRDGDEDVWAINGSNVRHWTLGDAVKYLVARGRRDADGEPTTWTGVKDWDDLGPGLQVFVPSTEGGTVDLDDSSTWELKDVICQDFDATGDAWPEAVQRLLEPHGFSVCFGLWNEGGEPRWYLCAYRKDAPTPLKRLYLQPAGATLDPGRSNVGGMRMARDSKDIANRIVVDTAPRRVEASFVLAPGFAIAAGDVADAADFHRDKIGDDASSDDYQKYRTFVFDELGEGHWSFDADATATTLGDLEGLFPPDEGEAPGLGSFENRSFVHRRRPGEGRLVDVDGAGAHREKELWVSTDYAGDAPGLWDGTGTWQLAGSGEYALLLDRLGVRLTMADVTKWIIGKSERADMPYPGGTLNVVQALAAPTDASPVFHLRLTCTVEDDRGLAVVAPRRSASPTRFEITRRVDARDRFEKHVISRYSSTLGAEGTDAQDEVARDDTAKAQDHADGLRRAHERARFAGSVTIPRLSLGYQLGDKIMGVEGRDVLLKTNAGGEQGEADTYPVVVGFRWTCEEPQSTELTLSDFRAEPPRRRTR